MLKQVGAIRDISSTVLLLLHIVGPQGGTPGHTLGGPKMDSTRPVLFKARYNSFHKCSVQPFFSLRRGDIPISHDVSQSSIFIPIRFMDPWSNAARPLDTISS